MKLKRTLIAFLTIIIVFTVYGTYREHGDANSGSMYGLIAIFPAAIISTVSYLLYYILDSTSPDTEWNSRKNYVHLTIGFVLIFLNPQNAIFMIIVFGLFIILAINIMAV